MANTTTHEAGFRLAGERPLTETEIGEIRRMARRLGGLAGLAWGGVLLSFGVFLGTMASLHPGDASPWWPVAFLLSIALLALCLLAAYEASRRRTRLREDARAGMALRYVGRLSWHDYRTSVQRQLLRRGLLWKEGGREQSIEILPASGLVWRVNGGTPGRSYYETEVIASTVAEQAATPGKPRRGMRTSLQRLGAWCGLLLLWPFWTAIATQTLALPGPRLLRTALGMGIVLAAVLVNTGVHEGGHILAGWIMGMRFAWCQVGPLVLWRSVCGLRCAWAGLRSWDTGFAQMAVLDERRYRWREGWMIAGGPHASLLLAGGTMALAGAAATGKVWPAGESLFVTMAWLAGFTCFGSAFPWTDRKSRHASDGGLLYRLWREPDGARHQAAASVLWGRDLIGERPRDWDEDLLDRAGADPWGGRVTWGGLMRYYHALDAGREEEARAELERGVREGAGAAFHGEAAFFHALYERDAAAARAHRDAIRESEWSERDADCLRVEAAVRLIEGDAAGARDAAEAALRALQREMGAGLVAARSEWLHKILALSAQEPAGTQGEMP